ncbi:TniB family NTP-binding protein [Rheinheimera aquimaris]|uniref:TniB family NTP-binding protein n=1 Tax=Rheinheimera aquimaris TaxID=412437 RepID=UPI001064DC7B|nr:TniB family NTP-binding protein [Rheinheimera aquimaris]
MALHIHSDKKFGDYVVSYPAFKTAIDVLERSFATNSSKPHAVIVHGPSGVGKSFLINRMLEVHKVEDTVELTAVPIVSVETPAENSINGFLISFLTALGDPAPTLGVTGSKRSRVLNLLKKLNTKLIIIDEAQDLIPKSGADAKSKLIKLLKNMMNLTKIPFAMVGTSNLLEIRTADIQIKTRVKEIVQLSYFNCFDTEQTLDFADYLSSLLSTYPRKVEGFDFCHESQQGELVLNKDICNLVRLALATDGCQRRIHDLLERIAVHTKTDEVITREHFAKYWNLADLLEEKLDFNPFAKTVGFEKVAKEAQLRGIYDRDNF